MFSTCFLFVLLYFQLFFIFIQLVFKTSENDHMFLENTLFFGTNSQKTISPNYALTLLPPITKEVMPWNASQPILFTSIN